MNWNALLPLLPVVGSIVGGTATIVTVIYWLMKRHARKLGKTEARVRRLEKEREALAQEKKEVELSNAALTTENATLKNDVRSWEQEAARYLASARQEHKEKKEAETLVEKTGADLKAAILSQQKAESHANETTEAAEKLDSELKSATAQRDAAVKAVQEARVERDALIASAAALETQIELVANQDGRVWQAQIMMQPPEFVPLGKRRTRIISLLNLKGGVGKTTITANLGGFLAKYQKKSVLLIDLDHQRSLSQLLLSTAHRKAAAKAGHTVQDFLLSARTGKDLCAVAERIPGLEGCSIICNSDAEPEYGTRKNLDDLEMELLGKWLVNPKGSDVRYLMRNALHSDVVCERPDGFDYILLDCPPRLTTACINALAASDFILIPTEAEEISARSVPHLLRRLKELHDTGILSDLKVLGILANKISAKVVDTKSAEAKVLFKTEGLAHKAWGGPVRVFETKLAASGFYPQRSGKLEESNKLSLAVDTSDIREQYENLLREIEGNIHEHRGVASVSS